MHRLFTGFLYKFILAELIRRYWLDPAASTPGLGGTLSYMYSYSLFLFFDFAGYSAFAVGVGYLFGVHTPEQHKMWGDGPLWQVAGIVLTIQAVCTGFLIFSGHPIDLSVR